MIDRLMNWLKDGDVTSAPDQVQLAVAALLLEAAAVADGTVDARERVLVLGLLERGFGLSDQDATALLRAAEARSEGTVQLFGFTSTLNQLMPRERKIAVIEMLWEVAYADGVLDPLEDTLLRRIAGLIDISDYERGAAKARVLTRLGLQPVE